MGWCNDVTNKKKYNKLFKIDKRIKHEMLFRKDYKYDLLIPIKYNYIKPLTGKGSCIFLHLTKNYKPTAGCIALKKKDFLIMLKLLNKEFKKTKSVFLINEIVELYINELTKLNEVLINLKYQYNNIELLDITNKKEAIYKLYQQHNKIEDFEIVIEKPKVNSYKK
jgi:hypothetical protein